MIIMMDNDKQVDPFNVGHLDNFTMLQLANKAKEVTISKSEIVFKENTTDDSKSKKRDITKMKSFIEWEPNVPLEEGLE